MRFALYVYWFAVGVFLGICLGTSVERGRKLQTVFETIPVSVAELGPAHAIAHNVLIYSYGADGRTIGTFTADRLDLGTARDFASLLDAMEGE